MNLKRSKKEKTRKKGQRTVGTNRKQIARWYI